MSEICQTCGLPKELCVCESIAKETQKIVVSIEKKKFGKVNTVIRGIDTKEIDIRELTKRLKNKLACGGTYKEGIIELQGSHQSKIKELLKENGFSPERIEMRSSQ